MPPHVSISAATRRTWEATRVEHDIAARKALGAYIAAAGEIRAADLRRSREFALKVRRFLEDIGRDRAA